MQIYFRTPGFSVLADQADEGVYLSCSDVFLQKLPVVVQQGCDSVFSKHIISYLLLHEAELLCYVLLNTNNERKRTFLHLVQYIVRGVVSGFCNCSSVILFAFILFHSSLT